MVPQRQNENGFFPFDAPRLFSDGDQADPVEKKKINDPGHNTGARSNERHVLQMKRKPSLLLFCATNEKKMNPGSRIPLEQKEKGFWRILASRAPS